MQDEEDIPLDPSTLIRLGTVQSVSLRPPRITLLIGDPEADGDDLETPPLRWFALRSGATRRWSVPSVGEEAVLLCPDGQIGNGVALVGLINDSFPPAGDSLAEIITFADGAMLAYDPEAHRLSATLPEGGSAVITAPAGVKIIGNLMVTESISAAKNLSSGTSATGTFSTSGGQAVTVENGLITNIY